VQADYQRRYQEDMDHGSHGIDVKLPPVQGIILNIRESTKASLLRDVLH
jgi:hypothetical protein